MSDRPQQSSALSPGQLAIQKAHRSWHEIVSGEGPIPTTRNVVSSAALESGNTTLTK